MGTSKTARRSSPTGGAAKFRREGQVIWVTPMAKGTYARVLDPNSHRSLHVPVGSDAFAAAVADIVEFGAGAAVRARLEELGWEEALADLGARGVFSRGEEEAA